ncbi:MAG: hypothetical protein HYZ53_12245 [Planctomycetes bacterium]|nr:hypothetical protein [Planctomycetota bacterium]
MKNFLLVVVVVGFLAGSAFACGGVHGNNAAAALNSLFGQTVAEGESGRGGDHGVFLIGGDASTNSSYTNGGWTAGTAMVNWLLGTGLSIPGSSNSTVQEG